MMEEINHFPVLVNSVNSNLKTPSGVRYSQDAKSSLNMQACTENILSRLQDSGIKTVTENVSSGFGSGHDATDSDFDVLNMLNNPNNCIQNINLHNGMSSIAYPFNEASSTISPSNMLSYKACDSVDVLSCQKINDPTKNHTSILWDLDPSFNLSDLDLASKLNPTEDIFNMDNIMNLRDLEDSNNLFQKCMIKDINNQNEYDKMNFMNQQIFPPQSDQYLNGQEMLNFNDDNLCMDQIKNMDQMMAPLLDDSCIDMNNLILSDPILQNGNQMIPNIGNMYQNMGFPNANDNNQNVLVRVLQNGQMHLASINQQVLNQMLMNNARNNMNIMTNPGEINPQQMGNMINSNDSLIQKNYNQSVVQKNTETLDLMDNPTNWRRIPNNGGYQCNICNKCYTRKYGLKIHLRIHSGFKPLECKVCKKKFGDPSNMAKHIRLHSTEGSPYKCNLCNKPLVRRRDLERHMRSRHPDVAIRSNPEPQRRNG